MGRRRKGRDISGWVVIDKPSGVGSTDVVGKVRWAFGARKAGHAGTLDPGATGVLAVALGEATKTVPYVTDALKAYEFVVAFGAETTTDDAEGAVTRTSEVRPDRAQTNAALPAFTGDIEQVPPQVSAVKVAGQRAYDLAREGVVSDLAARPLYVDELSLLDADDVGGLEDNQIALRMVCGKGGYVRAIARDLGRALGSAAHVVRLRRVWAGPFDVAGAVTLDQIEDLAGTAEIDGLLQPLSSGLADVAECLLSAEAATRVRNGNPAPVLRTEAEFGEDAWASAAGQPVAVGRYQAGHFHPSRVFNL